MNSAAQARTVGSSFRIRGGVYLLGSFEKGVTVYRQQVRAHNLLWSLSKSKGTANAKVDIAIVGAGIAGLTAAACAIGLFPNARVFVFERSMDLCSLQQGCDSRWLHPRIYNWPEPGSRAPSASLPVLNWTAGRASDVADQILGGFANYVAGHSSLGRLNIYLGVEHLRILARKRTIEWIGKEGSADGQFVRVGSSCGQVKEFDLIIMATGFGMERQQAAYPTPSYWQNENLGQLRLDGFVQSFVVSGYGDGALVDLCRLTIERFRQDRILYDLFDVGLESAEFQLQHLWKEASGEKSIFSVLQSAERVCLGPAVDALSKRIRKDTRVTLHLRGSKPSANAGLADVFRNTSSFTNRLLLYLLFRCGAFVPRFDELEAVVRDHSGPAQTIICRYGTDALAHVRSTFADAEEVMKDLNRLRQAQAQSDQRVWDLGVFPN
jgi:hypothetical protein